jgi:DNA-binding IclR family transcriptional regulator
VTVTSDNAKKPTTLQTAERALAFLEIVAQAVRPPKLKEVTAQLGLNVTTGYHMLNTLQRAGYLTREPDGTLRIGGRAAVLYQGLLRHFVLGRDLHPIVEQLSLQTHETAYLSSLSGEGVVVQALVEGTQAVRVTALYVGFSGDEHIRASGKAVLAFMPDIDRTALLIHSMGELTVREHVGLMDQLDSELAEVREQGWALDDRQFQDSVCCVAAPFFTSDGTVSGSIAVSLPADRFPQSKPEVVSAVRAAGRRISETLGYQGGSPGTR